MLASIAQMAHEGMLKHADVFTHPPISMAELDARITIFKTKITARASNATADVLALQLARQDMLGTLNSLGSYVNVVAKGDPAIVQQSGLPYYITGRSLLPQPPPPPQNLRLRHGAGTGMVIVRYRASKAYAAHEVQVNVGDPFVEEHWQPRATYYGGKAVLTGFAAATLLHVRVRTVGREGTVSNWGNTAQILVL